MGHADCVSMLLQAQADVNAFGGEFGSALAAARAEGDGEVIELLCQADAVEQPLPEGQIWNWDSFRSEKAGDNNDEA